MIDRLQGVAAPQFAARHLLRHPHREPRLAAARPAFVKGLREMREAPRFADDELIEGEQRVRGQRSDQHRSEEHTSELQSIMRISYAVFCLKKKKNKQKD